MTTHTIQFLPHNREIKVNDGESLIRAAMEAGVHINASCGGEGVCGKCRVIVEEGGVEEGLSEKLSPEELLARLIEEDEDHTENTRYILAVMLRFLLQTVRADFYNPLVQVLVKITDPLLVPLRRLIPGMFGLDMAAVALLLVLWLTN